MSNRERLTRARRAVTEAILDAERYSILAARERDERLKTVYRDIARAASNSVQTWGAIVSNF